MKEDVFVQESLVAAQQILAPPLRIQQHAPLLYQVTVNNRLEVTVNPRKLSRGQSAFQTDLCVFEDVGSESAFPEWLWNSKRVSLLMT
jgi:hypothetical protein